RASGLIGRVELVHVAAATGTHPGTPGEITRAIKSDHRRVTEHFVAELENLRLEDGPACVHQEASDGTAFLRVANGLPRISRRRADVRNERRHEELGGGRVRNARFGP